MARARRTASAKGASRRAITARAVGRRREEPPPDSSPVLRERVDALERELAVVRAERDELQAGEAHRRNLAEPSALAILAGRIAHDLNNLLMGILGNADAALVKLAPESPGRECLERIKVVSQRASELTGQMLAYSGRSSFQAESLTFPASNAPSVVASSEVDSEPVSGRGATILVVDDEPAVREVAMSLLEAAGHRVVLAADGHEGVEALRKHGRGIDLVLLDMTMPGLSGEEAFEEMRKVEPGVRVLLSSGYTEPDTGDLPPQNLAGFIQKPYGIRELRRKVETALAASATATLGCQPR